MRTLLKTLFLLLWLLWLPLAWAQPQRLALITDTNGTLLAHTNFFRANSNALYTVLSNNFAAGGGGGGTTYTNTTDIVGVISGSGIGTNTAHLATVTALTVVSNQVFAVSNNAATLASLTGVSNQVQAVSNYAAPRLAFDLVQEFDSRITTDDTNFLYSTGAGSFQGNGRYYWTSSQNRYTNQINPALGGFITNNGAAWVIGWSSAASLYTNITSPTGSYSLGTGSAPGPKVIYGTNILGTNYVWRKRSDWALLGMVFEGGGTGWPPANVDERGRIAVSGTGRDWSVSKQPQLIGSAGHLRDASLLLVSNVFWCAYTTNSATNASQAFSIARSTNLTHWVHHTNISPALSGETLTSLSRVWGPVFYQQPGSTNIWLVTAVATNYPANSNFTMRVQRTTPAQFPDGWSTAVNMANTTGYSNIIELTFGQDTNGTLYAFGTGTDTSTGVNHVRQYSFATNDDLTSTMSLVSAAPIANWGQAAEGVFLVRLWNGMWRLYWLFYSGNQNGNFGDGQTYRYSETTNLSSTVWSDPRMAEFDGFYAQNFKPIVLTDRDQIDLAVNAVRLAGDAGGILHVPSRYGDAVIDGTIYRTIRGLNRATNDVAAVNLGNSIWSLGGMYADTNNFVHLYAPTQNPTSEGNDVIDHGVTNVLSLRSNLITSRVAFTNSGPLTVAGHAQFLGAVNLTNATIWLTNDAIIQPPANVNAGGYLVRGGSHGMIPVSGGLALRANTTAELTITAGQLEVRSTSTFLGGSNAVFRGAVTATNGLQLIQSAFIITNGVPASTASTTNWVIQNINGIPTLVATNTAGGGGWLQKALYP